MKDLELVQLPSILHLSHVALMVFQTHREWVKELRLEVLFLDTNMFIRLEREALPACNIISNQKEINSYRVAWSQQANAHAQYGQRAAMWSSLVPRTHAL